MAAVDDLKAAVAAQQAEDAIVLAALTSLNTKVATLTEAIANAPNTDADVSAAAADIQVEVANFKAALAAPAVPVAS